MRLPKELTTVTPVSKTLALLLVLTLPVIGFLFGMWYQIQINLNNQFFVPVRTAYTHAATSLNEIANWKMYTDTKNGFSFSYPTGATIGSRQPDPFPVAVQIAYPDPSHIGGVVPGWGIIISEVLPNARHLSLRDWAQEHNRIGPVDGQYPTINDIKIGDHSAISIAWWNGGYVDYAVQRTNGITYIGVIIVEDAGSQDPSSNHKMVKQVLSTFKFLN